MSFEDAWDEIFAEMRAGLPEAESQAIVDLSRLAGCIGGPPVVWKAAGRMIADLREAGVGAKVVCETAMQAKKRAEEEAAGLREHLDELMRIVAEKRREIRQLKAAPTLNPGCVSIGAKKLRRIQRTAAEASAKVNRQRRHIAQLMRELESIKRAARTPSMN